MLGMRLTVSRVEGNGTAGWALLTIWQLTVWKSGRFAALTHRNAGRGLRDCQADVIKGKLPASLSYQGANHVGVRPAA